MLKYTLILAVTSLMLGCEQSSTHKTLADSLHMADTALKTISPARMIVPGKRIGLISINENADSVILKLGKPARADAAMGASMMTWFIKRKKHTYQTSIYAHRNMGGADEAVSHVKEIRVTSPWYKTADYSGAGSALKDIKKLYKLVMRPVSNPNIKKLSLYDDYGAGIGFEVDSTGKCTAVLVHAEGDSSVTYIDMHQ